MRLLAIGIVLATAIVAMLAAGLVGRPGASAAALTAPVVVKRSLSTSAVLFGDPVGAEIDVYSNDAVIAARSIRVSTDFGPFRVAATRIDRSSQGNVTLLRTRISLECLTRDCLPPKGGTRSSGSRRLPSPIARESGTHACSYHGNRCSSRRDLPAAAPRRDRRYRTAARAAVRALTASCCGRCSSWQRPVLGLVGAALVVTALWPPSLLAHRRAAAHPARALTSAGRGGGDERRRDGATAHPRRPRNTPGRYPFAVTRVADTGARVGADPPEPETLTLLAEQVRTTLNGGSRA